MSVPSQINDHLWQYEGYLFVLNDWPSLHAGIQKMLEGKSYSWVANIHGDNVDAVIQECKNHVDQMQPTLGAS